MIELAVKISDNPVSEYIHTKAKTGDILYIEGGQGDIYYEEKMGNRVTLIGAGIGIAPLMGMLRLIDQGKRVDVLMVQSASSLDELVYYREILEISERNDRVRYHPTLTQEKVDGINHGRITGDLLSALEVCPDSIFFLSGPGSMIPELEEALLRMGVRGENIRYEVWWKTDH